MIRNKLIFVVYIFCWTKLFNNIVKMGDKNEKFY